jgi:hypothetical protein
MRNVSFVQVSFSKGERALLFPQKIAFIAGFMRIVARGVMGVVASRVA